MSDDYLFDGTGTPDPDVEALEELLAPLAYSPRRRLPRWTAPLVLAAMVLLVAAAVMGTRPDPWSSETARCTGCVWTVGERLDTTTSATAKLALRGELNAAAGADVRRLEGEGARLELRRGRVQVAVDAPAGWLRIALPGVSLVDLGCAFEVVVADDGTGITRVTSGAVALEGRTRSVVPAGAMAASWPDGRAGLPVALGADPGWIARVDRFDQGEGELQELLDAAEEPSAALTLLHLLDRVPATRRAEVVLAMERVLPGTPLPAGLLTGAPQAWDETLALIVGRAF